MREVWMPRSYIFGAINNTFPIFFFSLSLFNFFDIGVARQHIAKSLGSFLHFSDKLLWTRKGPMLMHCDLKITSAYLSIDAYGRA